MKFSEIIQKMKDSHPFKKIGDRTSYSEYNEGWSDACDILGEEITKKLNELKFLCKTNINLLEVDYKETKELLDMYIFREKIDIYKSFLEKLD